ncbi:MAG: Xaa-Pro peptidase family protein [Bacillota bacterium]
MVPHMLTSDTIRGRRKGLSREMENQGIDWLYVSPGSDFRYLTGLTTGRSERPHALLLAGSGEEALLCPAFEADYVSRMADVDEIVPWEENADPFQTVADYWRSVREPLRVALGPQCSFEEYGAMAETCGAVEIVDAKPLIKGMRVIKSEAEIEIMRKITAITESALDDALSEDVAFGMTESDLGEKLERRALSYGADSASSTVLSGPHSSFPHGATGSRALGQDEILLIDFVTTLEGYHADITRTVVFGSVSSRMKEVFSAVREAARAATDAVVPGVKASRIDRIARKIMEDAGLSGAFVHRVGHGLGLDVHEDPYLVGNNDGVTAPAYSHVEIHDGLLEAGMLITIEPGAYLTDQFGIRIEDDILVTEDGYERLTDNVSKSLIL